MDKSRFRHPKSRYGLINFETALRYQKDLLEFKESAQCTVGPCLVQEVSIDRQKEQSIRFEGGLLDGGDVPANHTVHINKIKRIAAQEGGVFTVYYAEGGLLKKVEDTRISLKSPDLKIVKVQDKLYPLDLNTLKNFVSCSFYSNCGG